MPLAKMAFWGFAQSARQSPAKPLGWAGGTHVPRHGFSRWMSVRVSR